MNTLSRLLIDIEKKAWECVEINGFKVDQNEKNANPFYSRFFCLGGVSFSFAEQKYLNFLFYFGFLYMSLLFL